MLSRGWLAAAAGLAVLSAVSAVDRSKFRTCDQGSFCKRFKQWTTRPALTAPVWSVVPSSKVQQSDGSYTFDVKNVAEAAAHLRLTLHPYATGMLRIRLTEIAPLHPRYEIPAGDAVQDPAPPHASGVQQADTPDSTTLSFATATGSAVKAVLRHSPLAIDVFVDGNIVQRINARNLLNFERYRKPKELRPPDASASSADAATHIVDAAQMQHNTDSNGLWEEDFGGHTDKKPRGPASLGVDMTFEGDVPSVFGLPEHAAKAALTFYDEPYRFFNLDVFEYEIDNPMALYGAVPFLWAVHRGMGPEKKSIVSGFLWINPSETFVKLERSVPGVNTGPVNTWWVSESGVMDAVVFVGPNPAGVSSQFHALTGHAPMPPMWALGKHQCRWNYNSEKDVATVDSQMDKYDLPYDVIWLDIEHTDGKAYFTWNPTYFPTPDKMMENISAKKRKLVTVVDPHIKKEETYRVYTEIRDKDLFVKKIDWKTMDDTTDSKPADWVEEAEKQILDAAAVKPEVWSDEEDGTWVAPKIDNPAYKGEWKSRQITDPNSPMSNYEGWCWPGTSGYPDYTNPAMREYWASQFLLENYKGTTMDTYTWNDMNEPSVFNGPEVTMPRDAVHPYGNVEHRDVHNIYGYYHHRGTFEGQLMRNPNARAFVLTRSFFIGSHKYSAIWTGDNWASWEHLAASIPMVGALTLGGQSLVGADVGGFFKHPDDELMVRWYQLAAIAYPFFRNHAHLETPRREPYLYGEGTIEHLKGALHLRYRLLPLWYTVFQEYHAKGHPVVRPPFWNFYEDENTHAGETAVEQQIMLGDSLLVHGVFKALSNSKESTVYLPVGKSNGWYDLYSGTYSEPGSYTAQLELDSIPAWFRAGIVVPLKSRVRRSSACMHHDPFTLNIYLDQATGEAHGRLYLDDYETQAYNDGQSFLEVEFEFKDGVLRPSSVKGNLPAGTVSAEVERVELFGLAAEPKGAELNDKGQVRALPVPNSHELTGSMGSKTLFSSEVKLSPWLDMAQGLGWSLKLL